MRKIALQNKKSIVSGLRRYLFYNYDISELIDDIVEKSLKNIDNIKENYHDSGPKKQEPEKKFFSSVFKKILKTPEKDKTPALKFTQVKKIPLKMQEAIEKLQQKNPFEKLMLLAIDPEKIKMVDPEEFRKNQNEIYKKEAEQQAAGFIVEFNELIMQIGKYFFNFIKKKFF